ncbi:protein MOTHER of FT and TFL1-like [Telopea speciosissima]|uniref:protein MOTHER of FT and TFL1-like n=1 Tax=Telopea speciosissima TaxID=54955 RepID=UPI001CC3827D|nr:protein MOTHER of FT and TFL1-like [Telopea speciosissima]
MSSSVQSLVISRVIGDVIDMFSPSVSMSVKYGIKDVSNGCDIKPSMATNPPHIVISGHHDDLFTLVMTDPDAPSPSEPSMRELVHWIVVNIPGGTNPTRGKEILAYSCPRPQLGIHRFVFVLFKQKGVLNEVEQPETCNNFSTRAFTNKLELGIPVATVYFNARKEPAHRRR